MYNHLSLISLRLFTDNFSVLYEEKGCETPNLNLHYDFHTVGRTWWCSFSRYGVYCSVSQLSSNMYITETLSEYSQYLTGWRSVKFTLLNCSEREQIRLINPKENIRRFSLELIMCRFLSLDGKKNSYRHISRPHLISITS